MPQQQQQQQAVIKIPSSQQNLKSETSIHHHSIITPRVPAIQVITPSIDKLNAPIPPAGPTESVESPLPPKSMTSKHVAFATPGIVKGSTPQEIVTDSAHGIPTEGSAVHLKTSVVTSAVTVKSSPSSSSPTTKKSIPNSNVKDTPKKAEETTAEKVTNSTMKKPKPPSSTKDADPSVVNVGKAEKDAIIRSESPDIYDMSLNDDDDDDVDNDEQNLDLYNNISTASQKGDIPDTHADLFYDAATTTAAVAVDAEQVAACDNDNKETEKDQSKTGDQTSANIDGETLTSKQSTLKNEQQPIVTLTSPVNDGIKNKPEAKETDLTPPKERPGTPLLDEPVAEKLASSTNTSVSSLVTKNKPAPASLKLSLGKGAEDSAPGSPGSTPEAHTPLMDEPVAFNFPPPDPAVVVDSLSGDYMRFQSHAVAASAPFNMAVSSSAVPAPPADGRYNQPQPPTEAFESITPPSSPEHSSSASTKIGAVGQQHLNPLEAAAPSPALNNPVAAFPFSAFNINVTGGSRSSSRSGSAGQSPGQSFNEQSPRSDFENSGAVASGSSGKSSSSKSNNSNKRKRGNMDSPDSFEPLKRTQKQSYRRSGSSSSNISKSPENSGR